MLHPFEFTGNVVDDQKLDSIPIYISHQDAEEEEEEEEEGGGGFSSSSPSSSSRSLKHYVRPHVATYAIDATNFNRVDKSTQYEFSYINRELIKCLSGLLMNPFEANVSNNNNNITSLSSSSSSLVHVESNNETYSLENQPFATGNWGCGGFQGDIELKFMIQWLASSLSSREMIYSSFGDARLSLVTVNLLATQVKANPNLLTPSFFYQCICEYGDKMQNWRRKHQLEGLLSFLLNRAQTYVLEESKQKTVKETEREEGHQQQQLQKPKEKQEELEKEGNH